MQAVVTTGSVEAKPQGGDTRSHRIEAFSSVILAAVVAQKDISLVELADLLRTEHGASFGASTVWRCLDRHGMTFKKNGARRRAGAARRRSPAPGLGRRPA
jgi:transposase